LIFPIDHFFLTAPPMEILVAKSAGRERRNVKTRPVRCLTTGAVYASTRDAADILAMQGTMLTPESIAHACQGRQKSAGGLAWEYAEVTIDANYSGTGYIRP
jgi:hypothetical protein